MALDPSYFFYSDGTITLTNGSDIATGTFTAWDPAVLPFDFVYPNDGTAGMSVIKEVLAMDQIRLAKPWAGPTLTNVPYFMVRWTRHTDPRIYALRVSDYLARLKAIPENFEEVGQQVAEDAAAVASALTAISGYAQTASSAASAASGSATAAAGSATTAATSLTNFKNVYYGPLAADPATRPDGSARQEGDTYTRMTAPKGLRLFINGAWTAAAIDANGALLKANNLSDLADKAAARANLGLIWKPVQLIDITSPVTTIDVTLPSGWQVARIMGHVVPTLSTGSNGSLLRLSSDGAFFYAGAIDYTIAGINQFGSSVSGVAGVAASAMTLANETVVATLSEIFNAVLVNGTAGGRFPHSIASTSSYNAQGMTNSTISSFYNGAVAITTIRFLPLSGQFGIGTRFTVEVI